MNKLNMAAWKWINMPKIVLDDTVCGQLVNFLSSRVKSVFLHLTMKVGYNSRKSGMTLSGRSYITFLQLPVRE